MLSLLQPVAVLLEAITEDQAAWLWDKPRTDQECEKERSTLSKMEKNAGNYYFFALQAPDDIARFNLQGRVVLGTLRSPH